MKKSEEKTLTMALSAFVPKALPPMEKMEKVEKPVVKEERVLEPEVTEETPEKAEPVVLPEPIVEKVMPKKVLKKKPLKKKVKKKKASKKKAIKKKTAKKKSLKKQTSQKVSARKSKSSKAEKNQFLAKIRATINKHKSYPRLAKRRRVQGSIKVKFTILRSGNVGNISLKGPRVFHASARKAVKSAFPVNAKKSPMTLPQTINLTLNYQLR